MPDAFIDYTKIGQLLLRRGSITMKQLQRALRGQRDTGLKLGDQCVRMGFCTRQEVSDALDEQDHRRFLPNGVDGSSNAAFERAQLALERIEKCVDIDGADSENPSKLVIKL